MLRKRCAVALRLKRSRTGRRPVNVVALLFSTAVDTFLTSYDLSLAARGDTRRLWAERYLGLQKPQSGVEAYALHEVLCEELVKQTSAGTICDMRRCGLVPSGPAYRKAILDELTQNHTVTHSRWFYANASIDIPALSMDHSGLVHARTLAFAPECRTDDRVRADGGRMLAFDLAALALTQGGVENPHGFPSKPSPAKR
jgi:hypothetical protein